MGFYGRRIQTKVKHPDEIVNESATLELPTGATISTVEVLSVNPTGELTATMHPTAGSVVTCQLAAGEVHTTYVVTIRAILSNAERRVIVLTVDVK